MKHVLLSSTFKDERAEAQRSHMAFPRDTASKWWRWDFNSQSNSRAIHLKQCACCVLDTETCVILYNLLNDYVRWILSFFSLMDRELSLRKIRWFSLELLVEELQVEPTSSTLRSRVLSAKPYFFSNLTHQFQLGLNSASNSNSIRIEFGILQIAKNNSGISKHGLYWVGQNVRLGFCNIL